jgi:hypothetical protein
MKEAKIKLTSKQWSIKPNLILLQISLYLWQDLMLLMSHSTQATVTPFLSLEQTYALSLGPLYKVFPLLGTLFTKKSARFTPFLPSGIYTLLH